MASCRVCKTTFEAQGYRDELCPSCGALAPVSVHPCPCCTLPMTHREIDGLSVDECVDCGGVFLDNHTHTRLFEDHTLMRASAFAASLSVSADAQAASKGRPPLTCPVCAHPMQRRLSESGANIMYDVCPDDGVFYDGGKLPTIVKFMCKQQRHAARGGFPPAEDAAPASALACPACADLMDRRLSDSGAGVVLDVCAAHGTFFEAGKLPAIVAFVRKAAARSAAEGHAYAPAVTSTQYKHAGERGGEAIFAGLIAVGFLVLRFVIEWAAHH